MNADIARILTRADIDPADYPQSVKDARAFEAAALALIDQIKAESPVDLETATTPKDIAKVHAAAVAYDRDHDAALRHAETLVRIADRRVDEAWRGSLSAVATGLAQRFDAAAATFTTIAANYPDRDAVARAAAEHWNPDTAELRDALDTLNALHECRDILAGLWVVQAVPFSSTYERESRTLRFESAQAQAAFHQKAGEDRDNFYLHAAFTPGVQIAWQTPAQQAAQPAPASVTRDQAALLHAVGR